MKTRELFNTLKDSVLIPPEKRNVGSKERIVSAAAGLLLGYYAMRSSRKGKSSLLTPAGYLLWRGISGYCAVNALIGRNTAEDLKVTRQKSEAGKNETGEISSKKTKVPA